MQMFLEAIVMYRCTTKSVKVRSKLQHVGFETKSRGMTKEALTITLIKFCCHVMIIIILISMIINMLILLLLLLILLNIINIIKYY